MAPKIPSPAFVIDLIDNTTLKCESLGPRKGHTPTLEDELNHNSHRLSPRDNHGALQRPNACLWENRRSQPDGPKKDDVIESQTKPRIGLILAGEFSTLFDNRRSRTTRNNLIAAFNAEGIEPSAQTSKQSIVGSGLKAADNSSARRISERLVALAVKDNLLTEEASDALHSLQQTFVRVGAKLSSSGQLEWNESPPSQFPAPAEAPGHLHERNTRPMQTPSPTYPISRVNNRAVFIVHGRNKEAKTQLDLFLRYIDVVPIAWHEAANLTNKTLPTTMEIIEAGMARARAVVVLFTPDDEARLKPKFCNPEGEGPHEVSLTGQPRQNVLLEAGMALGKDPGRTIFVRLGKNRNISDIEGINWIDLDDEFPNRSRLYSALKFAGVEVRDLDGLHLTATEAGKFSGLSC